MLKKLTIRKGADAAAVGRRRGNNRLQGTGTGVENSLCDLRDYAAGYSTLRCDDHSRRVMLASHGTLRNTLNYRLRDKISSNRIMLSPQAIPDRWSASREMFMGKSRGNAE